jgi:hypothetical protein
LRAGDGTHKRRQAVGSGQEAAGTCLSSCTQAQALLLRALHKHSAAMQAHISVSGDQDVLGLDVAVHNAQRVQALQGCASMWGMVRGEEEAEQGVGEGVETGGGGRGRIETQRAVGQGASRG